MAEHGAQLTIPVHERDHASGPITAPLVLVEYGDYDCSHCGDVYPVIRTLRARFGAALTFVYRNFPLTSIHVHAQRAAETAEWAALAGRFWEMHDDLYEHQSRLDDRGLLAAALRLGLDPRALQQAWDDYAMIPRVKEDFLGGIKSGVTGTPKFFVNGVRHDGVASLEGLTAALEAARSTTR
ncbi:MAG: DsbA family protein [Myxococcales bacterium]|nr:DsbA family protein [Myxococcales bacterium]